MVMKFIPIVMVVISSLGYHLCQKLTPSNLSPLVALIITYVCASVVSILSYLIFVPKADMVSLVESIKTANMASVILGCAVVGLELGFLLAYRSGWNISSASLLSNTLVALLLIPVGLLLYKENITLNTVIGVLLCITGLGFVSR